MEAFLRDGNSLAVSIFVGGLGAGIIAMILSLVMLPAIPDRPTGESADMHRQVRARKRSSF
jgi:hypothetical protein